ncbi:allophanate hydrolase subunit 2 family protein, partial [Kitasatospora purpeofusca]
AAPRARDRPIARAPGHAACPAEAGAGRGAPPPRPPPPRDRVGMRLAGPELRRARTGELPSEAAVPGALQVPPDGQPILFLADHPVTGGYPVIATVHEDDLPLAAQARPGQALRFRPL